MNSQVYKPYDFVAGHIRVDYLLQTNRIDLATAEKWWGILAKAIKFAGNEKHHFNHLRQAYEGAFVDVVLNWLCCLNNQIFRNLTVKARSFVFKQFGAVMDHIEEFEDGFRHFQNMLVCSMLLDEEEREAELDAQLAEMMEDIEEDEEEIAEWLEEPVPEEFARKSAPQKSAFEKFCDEHGFKFEDHGAGPSNWADEE